MQINMMKILDIKVLFRQKTECIIKNYKIRKTLKPIINKIKNLKIVEIIHKMKK